MPTKNIDKEIFEVENRLHMREALIRQTAAETKSRTLHSLKSPLAIGGAVVLGFLVAGTLGRRRPKKKVVVARRSSDKSSGLAIGTLLMTGASWLIRSQFGGPAGLAHFVVSKLKNKSNKSAPAYP